MVPLQSVSSTSCRRLLNSSLLSTLLIRCIFLKKTICRHDVQYWWSLLVEPGTYLPNSVCLKGNTRFRRAIGHCSLYRVRDGFGSPFLTKYSRERNLSSRRGERGIWKGKARNEREMDCEEGSSREARDRVGNQEW